MFAGNLEKIEQSKECNRYACQDNKINLSSHRQEERSIQQLFRVYSGSHRELGGARKYVEVPYVTGQNGGGAFFLLFILCLVLVGLPVLLGELTVGRAGRGDPVTAFRKLSGKRSWGAIGFIAVLAPFLILTYYSTIAGWTLHYAFESLTGVLYADPDYSGHFTAFTAGWGRFCGSWPCFC